MSKQQLQCEQAAKNAYVAAMAEVSLFCKILGYPDSQANYLIGDDPHGIVDIMEGYRIFNMTDYYYYTPYQAYKALIDRLNKRGFFESNPIVYAYTYELID